LPANVVAVTNPLDATGGRDPSSDTRIRIDAPQQFRAVLYRAVQPVDFSTILERELDEELQRAGAVIRWTGSWPTEFATPDPHDATGLTRELRLQVEALVDRVRQAGREVKVLDPRYANFDLEIMICAAPNAYRGEVKEAVLLALFGEDGSSGFFDPDNFTFGTPLSRAALIAAIQAVPGVRAVEAMRVRRRGWFEWRDFSEYSLPVGVDEVVRVANTRELPERGAVRLIMEGGA
jgi:predicted phage baseplate assembly protein